MNPLAAVEGQVARNGLHRVARGAKIGVRREGDTQPVGDAIFAGERHDVAEDDVLRRQCAAEVLLVAVQQLADRAVEVHLVHEVQATAQVEAQRHGPQAHAAEEGRRPRRACQRRHVVGAHLLAHRIATTQLVGDIVEQHHHAAVIDERALDRHATLAQQRIQRLLAGGVDRGPVLAGDLQRQVVTEEIGQGEGQRQQHHDCDEDVLPAGELQHGGSVALVGSLGNQRGDLALLDLDAHAVGDLDGDEAVADVGDPAEDAARGDHFVAAAASLESMAWCSFARFCCGRINRK